MAYSGTTYDNPQSVTIGSTSITGVQSVSVVVEYAEVHASADDDAHESVARFTTASTRPGARISRAYARTSSSVRSAAGPRTCRIVISTGSSLTAPSGR